MSYEPRLYSMIWLRIDDPLDAVAVHSGGGVVGVLATPAVPQ